VSKVADRLKEERAQARRDEREKKRAERRQKGPTPAPVDTAALRPRLLIVCEGAKTEPNYFECFPVNKVVKGAGDHTLGLVERAVQARDEEGPFTEVWVVMDRDSFEIERFNAALALADREGMQVAYSNQAFEVWYLLHFEYCDSDLDRSTYAERLSGYLERRYAKNQRDLYAVLESRQESAIQRAGRLLTHHGDTAPVSACPSTTVHRLVARLRALQR
jgi:hypothetical protein